MSLPLKTTADDVRAIAKYLKTKPTGASVAEVKAVSKALADGRKLAALAGWGIITRSDGCCGLGSADQLLSGIPTVSKRYSVASSVTFGHTTPPLSGRTIRAWAR
jgi:hypothetical protein